MLDTKPLVKVAASDDVLYRAYRLVCDKYRYVTPKDWAPKSYLTIANLKQALQSISEAAGWTFNVIREETYHGLSYHLKTTDSENYELEFYINNVHGIAGFSYGCFAMTMENADSLIGQKLPPLRSSYASKCLSMTEIANYVYRALCPVDTGETMGVVSKYADYMIPCFDPSDFCKMRWSVGKMLSNDMCEVVIV